MYTFKPFANSELEGGGWSTAGPGSFVPGKHHVSIIQEIGWTSAPGKTGTGIDPRTVQPLGSHCTDLGGQIKDYIRVKVKYTVMVRVLIRSDIQVFNRI